MALAHMPRPAISASQSAGHLQPQGHKGDATASQVGRFWGQSGASIWFGMTGGILKSLPIIIPPETPILQLKKT
jgi:hypothetical protein